jgi:hypothetical protein
MVGVARGADYIWWEGERPTISNFPPEGPFSHTALGDACKLLSNSEWLSIAGPQPGLKTAPYAKYRIEIPKAGTYNLWCRKFWKHGPFNWRFDNQPWTLCPKDVGLADETFLKPNIVANWVYLGKVTLDKGKTTFQLELVTPDNNEYVAAFDCFVLVPGAFQPNGRYKPDEKTHLAEEDFFAWEPPLDDFHSSPIDLRSLNENVAGEHGYLRRAGHTITLADGKPVRLFGINVGPENFRQDHETIDYLARKLAKLGFNAVRVHGQLFDINADPAASPLPGDVEKLQYLVHALKQNGIYTEISCYFPLWFDMASSNLVDGYAGFKNTKPFAVMFFNPAMQARYKAWLKRVLTEPNPYTNVPLATDPAVAMIELVNEDSLFFWTFNKDNIPPSQWKILEDKFGNRIEPVWSMTRDGLKNASSAQRLRIADQVRFLANVQRDFYKSMWNYLKTDLHYGGLIVASNWTTADNAILDPVERYTYTAGDVMDRHGYFNNPHEGEGADYSVRTGHTFRSLSPLMAPEQVPLGVIRIDGFPQIISEIGYASPNRFRAESTLLTAAYASMQDIDGVFFFGLNSDFFHDATLGRGSLSSPVTYATFPAAALLFRRSDVAPAMPAYVEWSSPAELMDLKATAASAQALDSIRRHDAPEGVVAPGGDLDPLTYFVGPVVRTYDAGSRIASVHPEFYINHKAKTVRSSNNAVSWDFGNGLLTVNTPLTAGVAGFLAKAGKATAGPLSIECQDEYAAFTATSLDHQPLDQSHKILVQAMTEDRPYGFKTAGDTITSLGGVPYNVRKIHAKLALNFDTALAPITSPLSASAIALDENGYPAKKLQLPGNAIELLWPDECVYVVISR